MHIKDRYLKSGFHLVYSVCVNGDNYIDLICYTSNYVTNPIMSFLLLFVSRVLFVNMFCINLISILKSYENIVHKLLASVPKTLHVTYGRSSLSLFGARTLNMSNEYLSADEILSGCGEMETMRLEDIIDSNDTEGDINVFRPSPYYLNDNLPSYLKETGKINILSLNAQSINSKFDSILLLLETTKAQNIYFHVVCLRETWLNDNSDLSLFNIDGYIRYSQGTRFSRHGGLITYVDSKSNSSARDIDINSEIWEGLFISVVDNVTGKETDFGNIYRHLMITTMVFGNIYRHLMIITMKKMLTLSWSNWIQ